MNSFSQLTSGYTEKMKKIDLNTHPITNKNYAMKTYNIITLLFFLLIVYVPATIVAQSSEPAEKAFILNADDEGLEWGACPEFIPGDCSIAILQGDPSEPNADLFFKLQGNTKVPKHIHSAAERMVLISGEFHVNYEGQDPVVMTAGTYSYGPPGIPHTASCESDEPCVLFVVFEEPVDAIPVN